MAVAEELHFARAAERLGMEQSPLSNSIQNLEGRLGVKLLHRTTRRSWLTRAGERLLKEARRILADVEATEAALRSGEDEGLTLRLGLAEHAAGEAFTRLLFELEHRRPRIALDLREIASAEARRLVSDGSLEMTVILERVEAAGLRCTRAWAERLVLLAPFGHRLAEHDRVLLADVLRERFVMPHAGVSPGYAAQVGEFLERHGIRPERPLVAKHQNTMVSYVASGRGLALLPESVAHGFTTVAVLPLAADDAEVVSWMLYREADASCEAVAFALEVASSIDVREPVAKLASD